MRSKRTRHNHLHSTWKDPDIGVPFCGRREAKRVACLNSSNNESLQMPTARSGRSPFPRGRLGGTPVSIPGEQSANLRLSEIC
jgi:hypothetical protein